MKPIKSMLICVITMAFLCVPASADIKTGECGDGATWTLTEDGTLTVEGSGMLWNNTSEYFSNYIYDIERVIVQGDISTIGEGAFYDFIALEEVRIGDSVKTISDSAFSGCRSLEKVQMGSGVKSIGSNAFAECYMLEDIELPDSVKTIGRGAFYRCYGLTSVRGGNGVITIGDNAFEECRSLKAVVFPNSVKNIGRECFSQSGIENVTFGSNVSTIPSYIFRACDNLKSMTIPTSVRVIEELYELYYGDTWDSTPIIYYAGTRSQWDAINGSGKTELDDLAAHIYFNSTGPDDIGGDDPVSISLSAPTFGATIPITVSGSGDRTVNFSTAFFDASGRFIGMESVKSSVYPGSQSIFLPITQWAFVPTMRAFALDEAYRPLSPAGQEETGVEALPDKYADILSETGEDERAVLVDALTEAEAKDFVKRFSGWIN